MIRSDFVAERLKMLTRNGKSQAVILEEILAKESGDEVVFDPKENLRLFLAELKERGPSKKRKYASMSEFDAHEYDQQGNPR